MLHPNHQGNNVYHYLYDNINLTWLMTVKQKNISGIFTKYLLLDRCAYSLVLFVNTESQNWSVLENNIKVFFTLQGSIYSLESAWKCLHHLCVSGHVNSFPNLCKTEFTLSGRPFSRPSICSQSDWSNSTLYTSVMLFVFNHLSTAGKAAVQQSASVSLWWRMWWGKWISL